MPASRAVGIALLAMCATAHGIALSSGRPLSRGGLGRARPGLPPPSLVRTSRRRPAAPARCSASNPPAEGYQVQQNTKAELMDMRTFRQLELACGGIAFGCALQMLTLPTPAWGFMLARWWFASRVCAILMSAASRGRLGASTFQLLNLGLLAGFTADALSLTMLRRHASVLPAILSRVVLSVPSVRALRNYGWPKPSLLVPLAPADANDALVVTYGACAAAGLWCGLVQPFVGVPAVAGAAAMQTVAGAALLALRGAARVGPKRLSSATYLRLNRAARTLAVFCASMTVSGAINGAAGPRLSPAAALSIGVNVATAIATTVGMRLGISYDEAAAAKSSSPDVIDVKVVPSTTDG